MFGRQNKNACHRIGEMLSPYIDGHLNSVERDVVEYHLDVCESCTRELGSLKATVELLHSMPIASVPRSFTLVEAPRKQAHVPFGMSVTNWLQGMAIINTTNMNRLRLATAIAAVLLLVILGGDLTGAFHTEGSSEIATPTGITQTTNNANTNDVQPSAYPTEAVSATASPSSTPDGEEDIPGQAIAVPPNGEAQQPDPSSGTEGSSGIATNTAGDGEGMSPLPSPSTPSSEGDSIAQEGASQIPAGAEASLPIDPALNIGDKGAYSWLRPLEITLTALVIMLAGINILAWQRKRKSITI